MLSSRKISGSLVEMDGNTMYGRKGKKIKLMLKVGWIFLSIQSFFVYLKQKIKN
jgi:hypothetical protein